MTFNDYWRRLIERDPRLLKHDKMKVSIPSFRAELERAFNAGRAMAMGREPMETGDAGMSLFERLFGR